MGLAHLPSMEASAWNFSGRILNFAHAAHVVETLQTKDDLKNELGTDFSQLPVYRLGGLLQIESLPHAARSLSSSAHRLPLLHSAVSRLNTLAATT
jgi:hypothetical protein